MVDIIKQLFDILVSYIGNSRTHTRKRHEKNLKFISQFKLKKCNLEKQFRSTSSSSNPPVGTEIDTLSELLLSLAFASLRLSILPVTLQLINILIKNFQCVSSAPLSPSHVSLHSDSIKMLYPEIIQLRCERQEKLSPTSSQLNEVSLGS